jgi:hypothetical protein
MKANYSAPNVEFIETGRMKVSWGHITLLYAELVSIMRLLARDPLKEWSHVINLSGYDFPVVPIEKLESFLAPRIGTVFMHSWPADESWQSYRSDLHIGCNMSVAAILGDNYTRLRNPLLQLPRSLSIFHC